VNLDSIFRFNTVLDAEDEPCRLHGKPALPIDLPWSQIHAPTWRMIGPRPWFPSDGILSRCQDDTTTPWVSEAKKPAWSASSPWGLEITPLSTTASIEPGTRQSSMVGSLAES
jgi:hypothetical protein